MKLTLSWTIFVASTFFTTCFSDIENGSGSLIFPIESLRRITRDVIPSTAENPLERLRILQEKVKAQMLEREKEKEAKKGIPSIPEPELKPPPPAAAEPEEYEDETTTSPSAPAPEEAPEEVEEEEEEKPKKKKKKKKKKAKKAEPPPPPPAQSPNLLGGLLGGLLG